MSSENEELVPDEDLPYYRKATVYGLAYQLHQNRLPVAGTKYDLYKTIVDAGLRLFTDDRFDDEDGSQRSDEGNDSQAEDSGAKSDEEGSDKPDDDQGGDDQGGDDQGGNGQEGDDQEGDDQGDDQGGDDQEGDDQGRQPSQTASIKRRRGSDDEDEGDDDDADDRGTNEQSPGPPARKRRRIAGVLPAELQIEIIRNLDALSLWNLITAAPEEYLNSGPEGGINALELEAQDQYAFDYPPPPRDRSDSGGSDVGGDDGDADGDGGDADVDDGDADGDDGDGDDGGSELSYHSDESEPEYPLSLLEWVGRRAIYDRHFRTSNRTRIMQVLDTYLARYGMADPDPGSGNPRERILNYFRPRPDLQALLPVHQRTQLGEAALLRRPGTVHLLLMRGSNVNQVQFSLTALDHACATIYGATGVDGAPAMYTIFALLGAGADVRLLRPNTQQEARDAVGELVGSPFEDPTTEWPRIDNHLGLSIREFIADERSNYFDRMLLAAYVIGAGAMAYPRFI